jgi:hypothetical protein
MRKVQIQFDKTRANFHEISTDALRPRHASLVEAELTDADLSGASALQLSVFYSSSAPLSISMTRRTTC